MLHLFLFGLKWIMSSQCKIVGYKHFGIARSAQNYNTKAANKLKMQKTRNHKLFINPSRTVENVIKGMINLFSLMLDFFLHLQQQKAEEIN